jgi:hypothetical protein
VAICAETEEVLVVSVDDHGGDLRSTRRVYEGLSGGALHLHIVLSPLRSIGDAWRQVDAWLACETAWIPQPTERHPELLGEFLALPGMHGNLVPDAHLAALVVFA